MFLLNIRMHALVIAMFSMLYAVISMFSYSMGLVNIGVYFVITFIIMLIQFMIGPKIVEWSMHVQYVKQEEFPQLFAMIKELSVKAKIPMPRVAVSPLQIPNAFAYGRWLADGRVCVTKGLIDLLNPQELKAVLGHEISHIKNRDVLTITLLSVVPLILYRISFHLLFFGGNRRRDSGNTALIGLAALLLYFLTNLIVLYGSRIREYFADRGSVVLGNHPKYLASALYKLVYGNARIPRNELKQVEGVKAFFANDPSRAMKDLNELRQIDRDLSGDIDSSELQALRAQNLHLRGSDRFFEIFSTHPNMLKRIKKLSTYMNS